MGSDSIYLNLRRCLRSDPEYIPNIESDNFDDDFMDYIITPMQKKVRCVEVESSKDCIPYDFNRGIITIFDISEKEYEDIKLCSRSFLDEACKLTLNYRDGNLVNFKDKEALPESSKAPKSIFGTPLALIPDNLKCPSTQLPRVIVELMRSLATIECFETNAGFRIDALDRKSCNYEHLISTGIEEKSFCLEDISPIVKMSLLKRYFRNIPGKLVNRSITDLMHKIQLTALESPSFSHIIRWILFYLPLENYKALASLCILLNKYAQHEEANQMSADSLAVCWTPVLFDVDTNVKYIEIITKTTCKLWDPKRAFPLYSVMEPNDLDLKKPLFPDDLVFPVENITGNLEQYPNLKSCLQKSHDSTPLTSSERSNLHEELYRMKLELLAKQQLYQSQFEELKNWMKESFDVESPQVLLDHQTKIKEAELAAEEAANQGNSKQHQRIRSLNPAASNSKAPEKQKPNGLERVSKNLNLSRMSQNGMTSGSTGTLIGVGGGQGQKDLSAIKSKVSNQIPINVFWNYIEPFFKPIDEDDLKFLDDPSRVMDVAPFVIPPLGMHYEKIWLEQYGYVVPGGDNSKRSSRALNESNSGIQVVQLRERLLSALIDKEAQITESIDDEQFEDEQVQQESFNPVPLDDRLRSSLTELGLTDLTNIRDYQENDEICVEMRSVQRQLREQIVLNQYRKKRLAEFIKSKLASQEFYSLVGDFDKQIDGIFQRRVKNAKKKKSSKGSAVDASAPASSSVNEIPTEAIQCLENRRILLESFAEIVPGRVESLCPENLVDFDVTVEGQVIASAKKSSKWLPLPEISLKQPLTSCQPAFPNSRE